MKTVLASLVLAALPIAAAAQPLAPLPARTQAEIDHLFKYIAQSDCRFQRNGSWHDMAAARSHVTMKFEYLADRGQIESTEGFIDKAASKSSLSGQEYLVQCAGAQPVPAGTWLKTELGRFRQPKN